jgi:hypothetical protein
MVALLAVAILHFTVSAFEADTSIGSCEAGPNLERVKSLRLYRMVCYQEPPVREFLRERPTQPGADTLQVDDSRCVSYFITVVDSAGNESCERGATVGVAPVGIPAPEPNDRYVLYDLSGRRVSGKLKPGIYVRRTFRGGKLVRTQKIVVFR